MTRLIRKVPLTYREYGAWWYIGETDTHFLAMKQDCEGGKSSEVHALSKENWEIKPTEVK